MKALTYEEAVERYGRRKVYQFDTPDVFSYRVDDRTQYLIKDGKILASGVAVWYFSNGYYKYKDNKGVDHLIREKDGKEIYKAPYIWCFEDGAFKYVDPTGEEHLVVEGEEVISGYNIYYEKDYYEYTTVDGVRYCVIDGETEQVIEREILIKEYIKPIPPNDLTQDGKK